MRLNLVVNTNNTEVRTKFFQPLIGLYLTVALKDKTVYEGVNVLDADHRTGMVTLLLLLQKPAETKVVPVHDIVKVEIH